MTMVNQVAYLLLFALSTAANSVNGLQNPTVTIGRAVGGVGDQIIRFPTTPTAFSFHSLLPFRHRFTSSLLLRSTSIDRSESSTNNSNSKYAELSTLELQTLFQLLSDTTILYDPSRGTCCRNKCSGCTYLDQSNGNFLYDEYSATNNDDFNDDVQGWLAPYVKVDFGDRVHVSQWSQRLFPTTQSPMEIVRESFALLFVESVTISPLALQSLWDIISPSPGYPKLSLTEITRSIKGMDGSVYEMGGAVNYQVFVKNMHRAAHNIIQLRNIEASRGNDRHTLDYDSMSKEELLEECLSRGMSTNFPKLKRIIIEELRFYDANGRQGKRHPVKNTLS